MLIEQIHIMFMFLLGWKFLGARAVLLRLTLPFFFRCEAVAFSIVKGGLLTILLYDFRLKFFRLSLYLRQNFLLLIDCFSSVLKNCLKTFKSSLGKMIWARVNNFCGLLSYHLLLLMRIWSWRNEWFRRLVKLKANLYCGLSYFVIALCAGHVTPHCVATNLTLL